jgi:phytoene dehydrogenase-like protein
MRRDNLAEEAAQPLERVTAQMLGSAAPVLCGSGAHPGGCVSGIPGMRAARAILEDPVPARTP